METIIGINDVRPKLSALIDSGNPVIITVNSEPKSVLVKYDDYLRLKKAEKSNKQLAMKLAVEKMRSRAIEIGLTEKDIAEEIQSSRAGE